jgi:FAD dependent monooxygenase
MAPIEKAEHYQVAIVGGGPAGLTLALACERFHIKYALFESQATLSPDNGASIGILPNGLRILDQLGVLNGVNGYAAQLSTWRHFDDNGNLLCANNAWGSYMER